MKATKVKGWKCSSCDELYSDEEDAAYCCGPEPADGWKCGECEDIYEDRDDAKECCR